MRICMSEWMNWHLFECMQIMDRLDWRGHPQGKLVSISIEYPSTVNSKGHLSPCTLITKRFFWLSGPFWAWKTCQLPGGDEQTPVLIEKDCLYSDKWNGVISLSISLSLSHNPRKASWLFFLLSLHCLFLLPNLIGTDPTHNMHHSHEPNLSEQWAPTH